MSAGKTRTVTSTRRKKRIQKVRLRMLTRRGCLLAQRIYKRGLHPAAMYGDEISGISDVEWRSMQRLASAAHSPMTAGRSLSALWLWYEDPTTSSAVAHLEVEQRGVARSHASAWRNWRTRPVLEGAQSACLAKNLGARQITTARAMAKCERPRWCNFSEPGQDKVDLALTFPVL